MRGVRKIDRHYSLVVTESETSLGLPLLCCFQRRLPLRLHSGESTEGFPKVVIPNLYTGLQQQVCTALCPVHLLFFHNNALVTLL